MRILNYETIINIVEKLKSKFAEFFPSTQYGGFINKETEITWEWLIQFEPLPIKNATADKLKEELFQHYLGGLDDLPEDISDKLLFIARSRIDFKAISTKYIKKYFK